MESLTELKPIPELPPPAERVRLRQAFGVTTTKLAASLRVNRKTLYHWETGDREPTGENRENYAAVLAGWAETLKQSRKRAG